MVSIRRRNDGGGGGGGGISSSGLYHPRRGGGYNNNNGSANKTIIKRLISLTVKVILFIYIIFLGFHLLRQSLNKKSASSIQQQQQQQQKALLNTKKQSNIRQTQQKEQQKIPEQQPPPKGIVKDTSNNGRGELDTTTKEETPEVDLREHYKEEEDINGNEKEEHEKEEEDTDTKKEGEEEEDGGDEEEGEIEKKQQHPDEVMKVPVVVVAEEDGGEDTGKKRDEYREDIEKDGEGEGTDGGDGDKETNDKEEDGEGEGEGDEKDGEGEGDEKGGDGEDGEDSGDKKDKEGDGDNIKGDGDTNEGPGDGENKNDINEKKKPDTSSKDIQDTTPYVVVENKEVERMLNEINTGPGQLGYIINLINERQNATFRNVPLPNDSDYYTKTQQYIQKELEPSLVVNKKLQSCEYNIGRKLYHHIECQNDYNNDDDHHPDYYAYNPASIPKTIYCSSNGKSPVTVPPKGIIKIDNNVDNESASVPSCLHRPAKYFHPKLDTNEIDYEHSIIVTDKQLKFPFDTSTVSTFDLQQVDQCDITCLYPKSVLDASMKLETMKTHNLYIAGTQWKIIRSMENPYDVASSRLESTAFRDDIYYSTTSFRSSIPLSFYKYGFGDAYLTNTTAVNWDTAANKATYLANTECSAYKKQKWLNALNVKVPVESYGLCSHTTNLAAGETIDTFEGRVALQKRNRIALILESGSNKDHITNQVWESLVSGAIPAIHGASNIIKHLPTASDGTPTAIYTSDFNHWDRFAEFVSTVSTNQTLYDTFHKWRTDPKAIQNFLTMYNFTRISPNCRLCLWAYAKKFGLGWDHQQQIVKDETNIPRRICLSADEDEDNKESTSAKTIIHPFIETWTDSGSEITISERKKSIDIKTCSKSFSMSKSEKVSVQDAESVSTTVSRRVYYHDGVTDIYVDSINSDNHKDISLRLQFNVRNTEGAYFPNTHTLIDSVRGSLMSSISIQDKNARVTVIVNWETQLHSPTDGIIEINMLDRYYSSNGDKENDNNNNVIRKQIRVIIEDLDPLHDKMTEFYPSYFGKIMMSDFIDPIEYYFTTTATSTSNDKEIQ